MECNILAEEYYGYGPHEESGGWIGHYYRWMMFQIRIHLPYKKEEGDPGEDGFLPSPPSDTYSPQQQERLAQLELKKDEEAMRAAKENAN